MRREREEYLNLLSGGFLLVGVKKAWRARPEIKMIKIVFPHQILHKTYSIVTFKKYIRV
jgi:hypothetical protein